MKEFRDRLGKPWAPPPSLISKAAGCFTLRKTPASSYVRRTPFGRECEVVSKTEVDSHKAEKPCNHWVFVTREVKDAAREHEVQRKEEFKDLVTREQAAETEEAPVKEENERGVNGEEPGDED